MTQPGSTVIIDVDVIRWGDYLADSRVHLFNAAGTPMTEPGSDSSWEDPGSSSTRDSYLTYTFAQPGVYYVALGDSWYATSNTVWRTGEQPPGAPWPNSNIDGIGPGQSFRLHISLTNAVTAITPQGADVTEIADGAAGELTTVHTRSGAIGFSDADPSDVHSAAFTPMAAGYLGEFSLGVVDQAGDSVGWSFSVADGALDFLQAGQTLTQDYRVTVSDGHGGTAAQIITLTLRGADDAPTAIAQASTTAVAADAGDGFVFGFGAGGDAGTAINLPGVGSSLEGLGHSLFQAGGAALIAFMDGDGWTLDARFQTPLPTDSFAV